MAVICGGYFSIDSAGGSGYLGAFLAGLIVGNMTELGLAMHSHHERDMRVLISTVADVMVILVFITLGANLPWGDISGNLAPALAVVATLVFVARPLAVLVCLLPDRRSRWTREEIVFLAWTRETGVVPAALAGIVVGLRVPHAELVVTTVALAIVVTLALQSTTKRWLARRLGLLEPIAVVPDDGEIVPDPVPMVGAAAVTIRGKLYTAIVVAVAGLALTAGVGIWALSELSGRFDTAQRAADARALALQLQFDVTDFNGWQTAYGYDDGRSRPVFLRSVARFRRDLARARTTLTRPAEARPIAGMQAGLAEFMRIDAEAWTALQAGATDKVKRLFLGPEITNFERIAAAAHSWPPPRTRMPRVRSGPSGMRASMRSGCSSRRP